MDEEALWEAIETEDKTVAGKRALNLLRPLQAVEVRMPIPDERFDGRELKPLGGASADVFFEEDRRIPEPRSEDDFRRD
jgi:hypothetical protein